MRLLEISIENGVSQDNLVQQDIKDELDSMIQEAKNALNPERLAKDGSGFTTLNKKVKSIESDLKTTKWANKVVASFVVDDFKGSLPQSFLDRFQLRKVQLSVSHT